MKKIYFFILLITAFTGSTVFGQCMLYPVSLTQRVNNSLIIVEGKVIDQKSFWNEAHNYIYTSNLIEVNQTLKGPVSSSFIEIITEGGQVGLNKQTVEPSLQLSIDEEGVFLLNGFNQSSQYGKPVYQAYSDNQGFVKFNLEENSARDPFNSYADINNNLYKSIGEIMSVNIPDFYNGTQIAKMNNAEASISSVTGISPTTITAGTFSILTITGAGFGSGPSSTNYVSFKNADDGGATYIQPHFSQYTSWSNTQIKVKVPSRGSLGSGGAGTGQVRVTTTTGSTLSATSLTITHSQMNIISSPITTASTVYNTRHVELNTPGNITWQMYTGFDALPLPKASFLRAFQTWRCGTYINWQLGNTTSVNTIASDGTNVIRFDIGSELPAGVLGRCTTYWSGCGSNPNINWYVSELDIVFDSGQTWQYGPALATGGQYDFESVAVHELGHGHQLGHVINSTSDFMHYSIANGQNKRNLLASGNQAGGLAVMARNITGGVCGKQVMTSLNSSNCIVTIPTASFAFNNPVCVGQVVTFTNLSTGSPSSNSWTITGGSPATSTVYSPTSTYATAGTKTITLIATNGLGSSAPLSKTISVFATPVISVSSASICPGETATLTASGSTAGYTWTPGNLNGATQTLNPSSTTVYNVTGSNGTCTANSSGMVTVYPGVNVVITPATSTLCAGQTTVLTASGANSYTWSTSATTSSILASNASTATYSIVGTNGFCSANASATVNISTCSNLSQNISNGFIKIYPNPTENIVTINFDNVFNGSVSIYNAIGQVVSIKKINNKNQVQVELTNEPNGIYIFKISSIDGSEKILKVIKE